MKYDCIIILTFCLVGFWNLNAYSDRLYTWEDKDGVFHITEEPPPENAKDTGIVEYTNPAEHPPEKKPTNPKQPPTVNQDIPTDTNKTIEITDNIEIESDYDDYDDDRDDLLGHQKKREHREGHKNRNTNTRSGRRH